MERDLIVAWIDGGAPEGRLGAARVATFWCRMHPEIRADRDGSCPLCGMALAAFEPDLARRYAWSIRARSAVRAGARRDLDIAVTEQSTGARVREFERVHEHPLHLFVVSEDFHHFQHVHPRLAENGRRSATWQPPTGGRYWFYGDFLPQGGSPQMLQRTIVIGRSGRPATAPHSSLAAAPDVCAAAAGGLTGRLTIPSLRAGDEHRVVIDLKEAASNASVADLQPYLGAWGHLFVVHEQHDEALHAHPDSTDTRAGGPTIAFDVLFPRAGTYYLWSQFQRRGTILTLPFVVQVQPRA
jgi:hypothetical protein